jgi:uncharacterized protein YggE
MRSLAVLAAAVVALVAGAADAGTDATPPVQRTIVVTGDGTVSTVPDRAQVSFGVSADAKTASGALRANAAEMTKVIAALKAQGVAAADIRTDAISLSARYSSTGDVLVGYTATNSVTGTLRSLANVGAVIDAAVDAGANQVSGPSLVRSDANGLYRQALRAAISNARAKAETIARASGLALRRVVGVTEGSGSPPMPLTKAADATASTPVEPGTQLVEATVTVTFAAA